MSTLDFKKTMDKAIRNCDANPKYRIRYKDLKTMETVKTEYFNNEQDVKRELTSSKNKNFMLYVDFYDKYLKKYTR